MNKHLLSIGIIMLGCTLCRPAVAQIASGDKLFIDFGRNDVTNGIIMPANTAMNTGAGNSTGVADANGNHWNNAWMNSAQSGGITPPSLTNLVTSANVGTGVGLSFSGGWQANGFAHGGLPEAQVTANQGALGDFAFRNALGDYYFLSAGGGPGTATMTFSGLDSALTYNFTIFGTRLQTSGGDVRNSIYSITDANGTHSFTLQTTGPGIGAGGYNGNNNTFAYLEGIVPSGGGTITLSLSNGAGSNFAYIGALQLTAVPEPEVGALVALGCLGLAILRRNRSKMARV